MSEETQTYWDPLWTTHVLVRVGSRPDSRLWTTVGHHPSSCGLLTQLDVDGLGYSSLPVASHTAPLHSGTVPVYYVVRLLSMNCNAVLRVSTLHFLLVLAKSHLGRPLGLPNAGLMAFYTGDLVDHFSLPLLWNVSLDSHQGQPGAPRWLVDCLGPKGSAYSLQLLTESLDIGETHDPQWVFTRRFRWRGE